MLTADFARSRTIDEDFGDAADRVLWFKTGMHVYDVVELAEEYASRGAEDGQGDAPSQFPSFEG